VKRNALLLGIPAVLLVLLLSEGFGSSHSAEISITADHPAEFRRTVLATVVALGGERTGESTDFAGRGSSTLTFAVPTARLEETLDALGDLGGAVTDQQVDLSSATDDAQSMSDRLDDVAGCLDSAGSSSQAIAECRADLDAAVGRFDEAGVDLERSELVVDISASGVSNPALVLAIVLLIAAAAGGAVLLWRLWRPSAPSDVDLRDFDEYDGDDDIHLRRN
jgi:hypothetical protein